jgi:hypothetical protein
VNPVEEFGIRDDVTGADKCQWRTGACDVVGDGAPSTAGKIIRSFQTVGFVGDAGESD